MGSTECSLELIKTILQKIYVHHHGISTPRHTEKILKAFREKEPFIIPRRASECSQISPWWHWMLKGNGTMPSECWEEIISDMEGAAKLLTKCKVTTWRYDLFQTPSGGIRPKERSRSRKAEDPESKAFISEGHQSESPESCKRRPRTTIGGGTQFSLEHVQAPRNKVSRQRQLFLILSDFINFIL